MTVFPEWNCGGAYCSSGVLCVALDFSAQLVVVSDCYTCLHRRCRSAPRTVSYAVPVPSMFRRRTPCARCSFGRHRPWFRPRRLRGSLRFLGPNRGFGTRRSLRRWLWSRPRLFYRSLRLLLGRSWRSRSSYRPLSLCFAGLRQRSSTRTKPTALHALTRESQRGVHSAGYKRIDDTAHLLFHIHKLRRYEWSYSVHPQAACQIDTPTQSHDVHHVYSLLHSGRVNKLARLIIPFGLQLLYKRLAQPSPRPRSHTSRLGYVNAVCRVPPQAVFLDLLLATSLRDVERVRRVRCDVVDDPVCVCGREADFERLELELGEAMHYCLHTKTKA